MVDLINVCLGDPGLPKQILAFCHCANCLTKKKLQMIEVGITRDGLQIWCARCNMNIAYFMIGAQTIPGCDLCKRGIRHAH